MDGESREGREEMVSGGGWDVLTVIVLVVATKDVLLWSFICSQIVPFLFMVIFFSLPVTILTLMGP